MARADVAERDIAGVEQLFARRSAEGSTDGLAVDVAAELEWWRSLAGRRPMTFAQFTDGE
jgi:hypothetical protein